MLVVVFHDASEGDDIIDENAVKYFGEDHMYSVTNVNDEIFVGISETIHHEIRHNIDMESRVFRETADGLLQMQLHECDFIEFRNTSEQTEYSLRVLPDDLVAQHIFLNILEE